MPSSAPLLFAASSFSAELAPANDGSGDWVVKQRGRECYRAPFDQFRASVLWKADVYRNEEEQRRLMANTLSMPDVVQIFNRDLEQRGAKVFTKSADVGDGDAIRGFVAESAEALGGLDIVICNASGGAGMGDAAWQANVDVDLLGSARAVEAAVPALEAASQDPTMRSRAEEALKRITGE